MSQKHPANSAIRLPSQINFRFLSVPELQPVACAQDAMDHDALSRRGSSNSEKESILDRDVYVPVNYISSEACALLAAAEASAARSVNILDEEATEFDLNGNASTLSNALGGMYDPERALPYKMAPPKRFFRTFWQSISLRILNRSAHIAWKSSMPGTVPVRQMA